jgi:hypothetical protein
MQRPALRAAADFQDVRPTIVEGRSRRGQFVLLAGAAPNVQHA